MKSLNYGFMVVWEAAKRPAAYYDMKGLIRKIYFLHLPGVITNR